ncbi:uncharacterized protein LOC122721996 [Manihot esculenta]|uniref:Uncharacterized protein n=2 Tax=Manihot esculenta TaxID=3983 RepID=A0ACB7GDD9_MANES|nr:uncharacterized protein LOC122721996 [Manihot esculenta]KAG8637745.1 hypothetical protein MANES_15G159901v8 [Manihot esculenta]
MSTIGSPKNKVPAVGTASLNLAEYASTAEQKELELSLPLSLPAGAAEPKPMLCISLILLELRFPEATKPLQREIVPVSSPPQSGETVSTEKDELSAIKAGLRKSHKADEDSNANRSSVSDFGDDNFAIGSWEHKEIISRDGHMKLQTEVFFASIDQRNERAAGESACTTLVAVIADWFHNNHGIMPIKSQFNHFLLFLASPLSDFSIPKAWTREDLTFCMVPCPLIIFGMRLVAVDRMRK